jgi:hypothetical protein
MTFFLLQATMLLTACVIAQLANCIVPLNKAKTTTQEPESFAGFNKIKTGINTKISYEANYVLTRDVLPKTAAKPLSKGSILSKLVRYNIYNTNKKVVFM